MLSMVQEAKASITPRNLKIYFAFFSYTRARIKELSKECWQLLLNDGSQKPTLGTKYAPCYLNATLVLVPPTQQTVVRNMCIYTYTHVHTFICILFPCITSSLLSYLYSSIILGFLFFNPQVHINPSHLIPTPQGCFQCSSFAYLQFHSRTVSNLSYVFVFNINTILGTIILSIAAKYL